MAGGAHARRDRPVGVTAPDGRYGCGGGGPADRCRARLGLASLVPGEVQAQVDDRPALAVQTGIGQLVESTERLLLGPGGLVQCLGGASGAQDAVGIVAHDLDARAPARPLDDVRGDPYVIETRHAFVGGAAQLRTFRRRQPERPDGPRVDAVGRCVVRTGGLRCQRRVHGQRVDDRRGLRGQRRRGRAGRGVGDDLPVLGGQRDPAIRLASQITHGLGDAVPTGMARRVAEQLVVDAGVRGEVLALFLLDRTGGGLYGEPCGGRHRTGRHQCRYGKQSAEQALAQRQTLRVPLPTTPTLSATPRHETPSWRQGRSACNPHRRR